MSTNRLTILGRRCLILAVLVFSVPFAARAQPDEEELTLKIYQVGDLVLNVRDYPYPGGSDRAPARVGGGMGMGMGMGGMGGSMEGMGGDMGSPPAGRTTASASAQITMDDLRNAITSVVEPTSWDEVGGPGSVEQLGTSLMIRQTATVHEQIESLLTQLRAETGERQNVAVDARWLFLDSDELDQLISPDQEGRPRIDREMLATFTRRPSSIRGLTKCFSGQLVYLVSGTQQNVVSSYIPIVGSLDRPQRQNAQYASLGGGARYTFTAQNPLGGLQPEASGGSRRSVGYQPVVEKPNFGALLEIRPTLISGEEAAIVDLKSTLTGPAEPLARSIVQRAPEHLAPEVDRVATTNHELATTLRIPLGEPVLVGGLTFVPRTIGSCRLVVEAEAGQPREAPAEPSQLYLILELR